MTSTEPRTEQANEKVSLPTLTAMVVGSMIKREESGAPPSSGSSAYSVFSRW